MTINGEWVREHRDEWCGTCGRTTHSKWLRLDPTREKSEIRWCEDGEHEYQAEAYFYCPPSEATRVD